MAGSRLAPTPADRPAPHRIRRRGTLLVAALVALTMVAASLTAPAAAATRPETASIANAQLQQLLDQIVAGGAAGAIGLVRQGDTTVRAASGTADLGTHRAMSVGDRFRVGSITKSFVATVVLQLVGEGRLG